MLTVSIVAFRSPRTAIGVDAIAAKRPVSYDGFAVRPEMYTPWLWGAATLTSIYEKMKPAVNVTPERAGEVRTFLEHTQCRILLHDRSPRDQQIPQFPARVPRDLFLHP